MRYLLTSILFLTLQITFSQAKYTKILKSIQEKESLYSGVAQQIWSYAEMGYQEQLSSALLQKTLKEEGFEITTGVADIPTAFVASYGSGGPIIAVLGEFDALPGLSQKAVPYKASNEGKAGHACGHHLFGTASAAAAIALKNYLISQNKPGTVRFYGCPAEEGGSGKVYMTRAGLFEDVDVALHWHADNKNSAGIRPALANKSAKFRFYGVSAHAAGAPEKGRSSLDAVEAMNNMVNMMREHTTESTRIHYVITKGGEAPNVVPDFAEVYYYARHSTRNEVVNVFDRIVNAAKGAALGTGTSMEYEMIGGTHELLHNEILQKMVHKNLETVGGYFYTAEDKVFAEKISKSLGLVLDTKYTEGVEPYSDSGKAGGSTDVGDVSFTVPTVGLRAATWVPGTSAHSWQAVAAGGTNIGNKGMMVAAKTIALTGMQLLDSPKIIKAAKEEFIKKRGADFKYTPMLGDRKPALNYRN
ncbi:MAG: aminobenzoyl-glutamate utilization protein B [Flavobacteriaceae bacterium]|jgi:aminobenzoyl-glutamate utilization protein B|tara:strand:+ start:4540 stop:5958 length:1419 start_codon:yes stop_codon:yes gene_type:complete